MILKVDVSQTTLKSLIMLKPVNVKCGMISRVMVNRRKEDIW